MPGNGVARGKPRHRARRRGRGDGAHVARRRARRALAPGRSRSTLPTQGTRATAPEHPIHGPAHTSTTAKHARRDRNATTDARSQPPRPSAATAQADAEATRTGTANDAAATSKPTDADPATPTGSTAERNGNGADNGHAARPATATRNGGTATGRQEAVARRAFRTPQPRHSTLVRGRTHARERPISFPGMRSLAAIAVVLAAVLRRRARSRARTVRKVERRTTLEAAVVREMNRVRADAGLRAAADVAEPAHGRARPLALDARARLLRP